MILPYFKTPSCCNALTLICMQTLKVKVKVLCDVFEKQESPPENGMFKVSPCCPGLVKFLKPSSTLRPRNLKT